MESWYQYCCKDGKGMESSVQPYGYNCSRNDCHPARRCDLLRYSMVHGPPCGISMTTPSMSYSPVTGHMGAGVLEGFQLFLKYDYIKGIFAMSCLFMVEVTILDYTMKKLANDEFAALYPGDQESATRAFVAFTGMFGQVVFLALILLKGFSYSLNNPCKEILYQPTNSAVKFKSKAASQSTIHITVPVVDHGLLRKFDHLMETGEVIGGDGEVRR
ncbi:unnamed protein product [Ectocarpus sp. CCAP 1310/34]|nr:unnamed protein product [Ectocarpus sp. CCAP 1310/34]